MTRFPPRSELPKTITIDNVPMLGTTWYERGPAYWLRRAGMVLMMAIALAVVTALLWGLFGAIRQSSVTGFWIALGVEIAYSVAVVVWLVVRTSHRWNNLDAARPTPANRRAGATGAALGTLARTGSFVGSLFLVVSSLVFLGVYVALFLAMLMPETIWERPARLAMADRLRRRGLSTQDPRVG